MYDVKRGSSWKRISAFLFDLIIFSIAALLFATLFSYLLHYDDRLSEYQARQSAVEERYGITFDISESEYMAYTEEQKAVYDQAFEALNADQEAVRLYVLLNNLAVLIVSFALLAGFLILEFLIPLSLREGRSLGKRIFGLCVVRQSGVRISGPVLFIRTILGKYAIETLIPAYILIMFFFGKANIFLVILFALIILSNIILFLFSRYHLALHDLIAVTVVADYETQQIFESEEAKADFIAKEEEERIRMSREENVFSRHD